MQSVLKYGSKRANHTVGVIGRTKRSVKIAVAELVVECIFIFIICCGIDDQGDSLCSVLPDCSRRGLLTWLQPYFGTQALLISLGVATSMSRDSKK